MIYGSVIDSKTMTPIFGAEVRIQRHQKEGLRLMMVNLPLK